MSWLRHHPRLGAGTAKPLKLVTGLRIQIGGLPVWERLVQSADKMI